MFENEISAKQLKANRSNAQKSTGPTSAEGKKIASQNGRRHGFTGQVLLETEEDAEACRKFTARYIADLAPEGFIETDLANSAAETAWRLNRMRAHENNYLAMRLARDGDRVETDYPQVHTALVHTEVVFDHSQEFCRLALYEQRLTNVLHKNLKVLDEMKRKRGVRKTLAELKVMSAGQSAGQATSSKSITSPENGFAFSNPQADPEPACVTLQPGFENAS